MTKSRMSVADLNTLVSAMHEENVKGLDFLQTRIVELEGQVAKLTTEKLARQAKAPAAPKKPVAPKQVWVDPCADERAAANAAWQAKCAAAKAEAMATHKRVTV